MKGNNIYEDREEKRARDAKRHTVYCPNCGEPVLDHLTVCPHCGGKLKPAVYQPLSDERIKKIRIVTYTIGALVAVGVILYLLLR